MTESKKLWTVRYTFSTHHDIQLYSDGDAGDLDEMSYPLIPDIYKDADITCIEYIDERGDIVGGQYSL